MTDDGRGVLREPVLMGVPPREDPVWEARGTVVERGVILGIAGGGAVGGLGAAAPTVIVGGLDGLEWGAGLLMIGGFFGLVAGLVLCWAFIPAILRAARRNAGVVPTRTLAVVAVIVAVAAVVVWLWVAAPYDLAELWPGPVVSAVVAVAVVVVGVPWCARPYADPRLAGLTDPRDS